MNEQTKTLVEKGEMLPLMEAFILYRVRVFIRESLRIFYVLGVVMWVAIGAM